MAAIGNFDGVHAGHREVLRVAGEKAEALAVPAVALTFEPHPRSVLFPDVPLKRLTGPEDKARLLAEAGADGVAVMAFDMDLAGWSPERFVDEALVGWLNVQAVVVGANFRYGRKAAGGVENLKADTRFETLVVPLVEDEGGVVSSRRLRGAVADADAG